MVQEDDRGPRPASERLDAVVEQGSHLASVVLVLRVNPCHRVDEDAHRIEVESLLQDRVRITVEPDRLLVEVTQVGRMLRSDTQPLQSRQDDVLRVLLVYVEDSPMLQQG